MTVIISHKEYAVKQNYLHRWNSKLILEHKEQNEEVYIQFELSDLSDFYLDKRSGLWKNKEYKACWYGKNGFRQIKISFKDINE